MTKTIRDNYRIYSLIMILNARTIISVKCGFFEMLNMNHLTMLLPRSRVHVNLSNDLGSYVVEDIPF